MDERRPTSALTASKDLRERGRRGSGSVPSSCCSHELPHPTTQEGREHGAGRVLIDHAILVSAIWIRPEHDHELAGGLSICSNIPNRAGIIGPGIDVRGTTGLKPDGSNSDICAAPGYEKFPHLVAGGYLAAAGSKRADGSRYRFMVGDYRTAEPAPLGARLRECVALMLAHADTPLPAILPYPDDLKFVSSMTLFEAVADDPTPFRRALEAFNGGRCDQATLELLGPR